MEDISFRDDAQATVLERYALSEHASRETLDRITQLAVRLLGAQGAQINLVGPDRQETQATFGWDPNNVIRELSFCAHTIAHTAPDAVFDIPDTSRDDRFEQHPLTTHGGLSSYAGVPLITSEGPIGALCLLDSVPRAPLTRDQQQVLADLARLATAELERQRDLRDLRNAGAATREVPIQAMRTALQLLHQDGEITRATWTGLLEAAVASVPGAEAGTLFVLEGQELVCRAQIGFSDGLLQLRQSLAGMSDWYGAGDWLTGDARLVEGREVVAVHARTAQSDVPARTLYEQHGRVHHLNANICVPVVLGAEVVAVINLDHFGQGLGFDATSLHTAQEFSKIAGALLADSRRQSRERARQRELEVLVRLSAELRTATTLETVEEVLCLEAAKLLGTENVVYLRYEPDDTLELTIRGWPYDQTPYTVTKDDSPFWGALREHRQWQVSRQGDSARLFSMERATLLITPLNADERPIGVMIAARAPGSVFSELDGQLIQAVASSGVTAMQRVWAEQQQADLVAELRLLADLARLKTVLEDPNDVAKRCLAASRAFLGADFAGYLHLERQVMVNDGVAPEAFQVAATELAAQKNFQALMPTDETVVVMASYAQRPDAVPSLVAAGVHGMAVASVMERGRRVGLVGFVWFSPVSALPASARNLTSRVAELIGRVVERHAFIHDLQQTREGALLALGRSLELRDFETHGHTERVVDMACRLGTALSMTDDELEGLRQGAYLHDVGKLAIPDAVLLKPGKLDPDEWILMQTHAAVGADMIAGIPAVHPLAHGVIRHHHERWDGTGYPDRLAGEAIPLGARLFSLVDVYDALTSSRPYKRAWTPEEATAELQRQAGAQFDPALVDVFLQEFRKV